MSGFEAYAAAPQDYRSQDTYSADFVESPSAEFSRGAEFTASPGYSYHVGQGTASRVAHAHLSTSGTAPAAMPTTHSTRNEQQARGLMSDNQNSRGSDKRKQSLYFPEAMLQEIKDEAARLDRSLSWIVQRAWKTARADIRKIPSVNEIDDDSLGGDEP